MQVRSPDAPRRILLIDDDVELTQMLREYFEPERWQFSVVHRGSDGEALLARDDHDLALLDLMLPTATGSNCCAAIARVRSARSSCSPRMATRPIA